MPLDSSHNCDVKDILDNLLLAAGVPSDAQTLRNLFAVQTVARTVCVTPVVDMTMLRAETRMMMLILVYVKRLRQASGHHVCNAPILNH